MKGQAVASSAREHDSRYPPPAPKGRLAPKSVIVQIGHVGTNRGLLTSGRPPTPHLACEKNSPNGGGVVVLLDYLCPYLVTILSLGVA